MDKEWESPSCPLFYRQEEAPDVGAGMVPLKFPDALADPGNLLIRGGNMKDIVFPDQM
jgi:hypothetical protein